MGREATKTGVAAGAREGLVVPVVTDAGSRGRGELWVAGGRVTTAARDGKSSVSDLQGGTFTLSNTGAWRGGLGTSLIRPPEVAIVAFGRIEEKAVVRDGKVLARPVMPLSLPFDHRLIDGDAGLSFAPTVRGFIHDPQQPGA